MVYRVTVLPEGQVIHAREGTVLLEALRRAGFYVDAPCGGQGTCGKCTVLVDGKQLQACRQVMDRDMTVVLSREEAVTGKEAADACADTPGDLLLALDIGTTTVVGYLLDKSTGKQLVSESRRNPQTAYGADVVSRIRLAMKGEMEALTRAIRLCAEDITRALCRRASVSPEQIRLVCPVGNPAMQQLFLGILPENLARIPFRPVLTRMKLVDAGEYLPLWANGKLLVVPDISGFVGADTLACILATGLEQGEKTTLLLDIGTNGEMVLAHRGRMAACATAAGPALEGAGISCGMRAESGAIDRVRVENGRLCCSVIGGTQAVGICGSGLIDAVAAALDMGWINARGKLREELVLTQKVRLTQEDIRGLQSAKGAIAAGIQVLADYLGITPEQIQEVKLAGAFGSHLDGESICRIGLLPQSLRERIRVVGNAAGDGACILATEEAAREKLEKLGERVEYIELGSCPAFAKIFARAMRFPEL